MAMRFFECDQWRHNQTKPFTCTLSLLHRCRLGGKKAVCTHTYTHTYTYTVHIHAVHTHKHTHTHTLFVYMLLTHIRTYIHCPHTVRTLFAHIYTPASAAPPKHLAASPASPHASASPVPSSTPPRPHPFSCVCPTSAYSRGWCCSAWHANQCVKAARITIKSRRKHPTWDIHYFGHIPIIPNQPVSLSEAEESTLLGTYTTEDILYFGHTPNIPNQPVSLSRAGESTPLPEAHQIAQKNVAKSRLCNQAV